MQGRKTIVGDCTWNHGEKICTVHVAAIVDATMAADKLAAYQATEAGRLRQVELPSGQAVALKA